MTYNIVIIGDYEPTKPSHKATEDAIKHCAEHLGLDIRHEWIPTESLNMDVEGVLNGFDGFWCAPGSPYKSMRGAINAIQYVREHGLPFIGTCGGFQHAVLEFAKNVLGIEDADHQEYNPDASNLLVAALSCPLFGQSKIVINENSQVYGIYKSTEVEERYTCSFGLNTGYLELFDRNGFKVAGNDENGEPRILELSGHRFYVATLFQPQLSSTCENPHKLVLAYLKAVAAI